MTYHGGKVMVETFHFGDVSYLKSYKGATRDLWSYYVNISIA